MFTGTIGKDNICTEQIKQFQVAFDFLKRKDLADLEEGWIDLGKGVRASVQHYSTMEEDALDFETHERFFDVQYLADGYEYIGVCGREGLTVKTPYNSENDVTFYRDPKQWGMVLLGPGDYVVLGPWDAHKPRCMAGASMPVKKIVIKVPVAVGG